MADVATSMKGGGGVAFLVAAGLVLEAVAAFCSSPQTAELNAKARSQTLMKWVKSGLGVAFVLIILAALLDRKHAPQIIAGGGLAGGAMWYSYHHANKAGLSSDLPGTEDYGPDNVTPMSMRRGN